MIFPNRQAAGKQLAEMLKMHLKMLDLSDKSEILVIGLPRGGVPVALEIARSLNCTLDILVAKKIGFPGQPEYAIGAVTSDGVVVVNAEMVTRNNLHGFVDEQRRQLLEQICVLEDNFRLLSNCPPANFKNKIIVLVDDGIATGMTALAAAKSARQRGAQRIIIAAPVMSTDSYYDLEQYCDDVLAISLPEEFLAVGYHYADFAQTTNDEVVSALREASQFSAMSF